jgi:hypothetical protein
LQSQSVDKGFDRYIRHCKVHQSVAATLRCIKLRKHSTARRVVPSLRSKATIIAFLAGASMIVQKRTPHGKRLVFGPISSHAQANLSNMKKPDSSLKCLHAS